MAGGTGGHVYPALAVAKALQAHAREIVWLGTHQGIESRIVPAAGIDIEWIFFVVVPLPCSAWVALRVVRVALPPG
jgi:UDP-N-acetylglucosamine:LPS N-acetylglucosamine transferase